MKATVDAAATGVGGSAAGVGGSETGRTDRAHPHQRALEMGVRVGPHPHAPGTISCLLGDVLEAAGTDLGDFGDLKPFEVAVLHPGRTLLEELVLINALAQQLAAGTGGSIDRRSGRHFYDMYQLLGDRQVLDLLADRDQTDRVMRSVEEINRAFFGGDGIEIRPAGGFATCPAFDSNSNISSQLRTAYESTMPERYFGTGSLPTWEDICTRAEQKHALAVRSAGDTSGHTTEPEMQPMEAT